MADAESLREALLELKVLREREAQALHESMSSEPLAPILARKYYPALERRLMMVLATVRDCVKRSILVKH